MEEEPRAGFVGWGVLDDVLEKVGAQEHPVAYPICELRRKVPMEPSEEPGQGR
jgi:hypothetical protein